MMPVAVGVLQCAQQIPGQGVHHRESVGAPLHRLLQPLAVDPVADPEGQVADDAGIVDVPDGRMVEPAQRLGLAQEPGRGWLVGRS